MLRSAAFRWGLTLLVIALAGGGILLVNRARDEGPKLAATTATVSLEQGDLPAGFVRCPFSGPIERYTAKIKFPNPDTYQAVSEQWAKLKGTGAIGGYAAFFGAPKSACDSILTGRMDDPQMLRSEGHPQTVFSFVIQFDRGPHAEKAYSADILTQSHLMTRPDTVVKQGLSTGLSKNSIVGQSHRAPLPIHDAVWQNGKFLILYGSENLPHPKADAVTRRMNSRIAS